MCLLQCRKQEVSQVEGTEVVDCLGGLQASHTCMSVRCEQATAHRSDGLPVT